MHDRVKDLVDQALRGEFKFGPELLPELEQLARRKGLCLSLDKGVYVVVEDYEDDGEDEDDETELLEFKTEVGLRSFLEWMPDV